MQLGFELPRPKAAPKPEIQSYGGDALFLRSSGRLTTNGPPLNVIDLFAGAGGLSLGADVAATEFGMNFRPRIAFESNHTAAAVYRNNFKTQVREDDLGTLFSPLGSTMNKRERDVAIEAIDLMLAGPPCQGHSDLNNFTRRNDSRNELYLAVSRAAQIYSPKHVIVENVPTARHDKERVVERTISALQTLGYDTAEIILDAKDFGVPQSRKRHFTIASIASLDGIIASIGERRMSTRTVRWAIEDLQESCDSDTIYNSPGDTKATNRSRIQYLFENDLYDLPDHMRPECHRSGSHSYKSVYGRLHWDRPAQTITRGFYSVSMGRYIHPNRPTTITAHEAARLQFIPDFFSFSEVSSRSALSDMIGNAVPPKLSFVVCSALLAMGETANARS